ncbi:MAG: glycosyltransferase family 9 protein [Thermodesulfobacteriota bacterium]
MKTVRKILAMHTGGIGDMLMLAPSLKLLRASYPDSEIHLLLESERTREVLERFCVVDSFVSLASPGLKRGFNLSVASDFFSSVLMLRKERYDACLIFQPVLSAGSALRLALFCALLGARTTVGRNTRGRGFFFKRKIKEDRAEVKHETLRMADVAWAISNGMFLPPPVLPPSEVPPMEIVITEDERLRTGKILKVGRLSDITVVVAPGFTMRTRGWYEDRWAELLNRIAGECKVKLVLIGGKKETEMAGRIKAKMKSDIVDLTGELSIFETAAAVDSADVFIGIDSGPMHVASILKPKVVALFGPGDASRIRPYGAQEDYRVVKNPCECAPCYKESCDDHSCMKSITVESVYSAFMDFYKPLSKN